MVQLAALGFGLGLVVPAMTAALLGSVNASRSGIASGTLNTARQAGSVIGVALLGSLARRRPRPECPAAALLEPGPVSSGALDHVTTYTLPDDPYTHLPPVVNSK